MNDFHHVPRKRNLMSAMFLVAGTCIGGGMLALPVATGIFGFVPSLVMMLVCWLTMTATALLLLEVSLWMEEGVHLISMVSRVLGTKAKIISWCLYLFICYASIVAYTAGAGPLIARAFQVYFDIPASKEMGCFIFIAIFGTVIYLGNRFIGRVNSVLFIAMILAYLGLIGMGLDEIKIDLLSTQRWTKSITAIPLLLTAFSFQTMVPSLTPYLKKNTQSLRLAIIGGTGIALLMYTVWQWLILGIVPLEGPFGLAEAMIKGEPATQFVKEHVQGLWINTVVEYFAFFAITTSFLGVTLGLFDFLSDGLHIKKEGWGKVVLGLLIVVPTLFFAIKYDRIFLLALDVSGGFGDSILNGMIPIAMVWIGRYRMGMNQNVQVPGGRPFLFLVFCFFAYTLVVAIFSQIGYFGPTYELHEVNIPNLESISEIRSADL